ncbi:CHAT domain-containing protein [Mesorhizobium sp. M0676]|uniref:CHAT domain-containing protein n=1 Tax=Mesorhizobium sp. M0676 TaxID=2956984 RepID=UPI00333AFA09
MRKWLKALMGKGSDAPRESGTPVRSEPEATDPAPDPPLQGLEVNCPRPIIDFMPDLYEQVAAVKADAKVKVENEHYWRHVGHVVGAAYALLSFMLESLPVIANQKVQALLALKYLEATHGIFQKYFSDYDEDGYGAASIAEIIEFVEKSLNGLTDAPSPSFLRDSAQIEARANAYDRYELAWDPTYLESVLVSPSKAHPRMVVELAVNASLDQLVRVHSLVDSDELHEAVSLIPQLRRGLEFQASLQAILGWNFRNLRLLSLSGLPFHVARYECLHILQLSLNAHKIWAPVGKPDRVAVDGAISELIAQSQRIDRDFYDADDVAEMLGLVLRTYHEGVYADGETDVEELEKSASLQRDNVAMLVCRINLAIAYQDYPVARHILDSAIKFAGRCRQDITSKLGSQSWCCIARAIGELCTSQSRDEEALTWACEAVSAMASRSHRPAFASPTFMDEIQATSIFSLVSSVLRSKDKESVIGQPQLWLLLKGMSALRDHIRSPNLPAGAGMELASLPIDTRLFVYFKIINLQALWSEYIERNKQARESWRYAVRAHRTTKALVGATNVDDYFAAYAKLESADSEYKPELEYSRYILFRLTGGDQTLKFFDLGHAAAIDRMIADYRGVVCGLGEAESRAKLIPPARITITHFPPSEDEVTDENFFIPLKALRLKSALGLGFSAQHDTELIIVPDSEIFRIPLNTIFINCRAEDDERVTVSKALTLAQALSSLTSGSAEPVTLSQGAIVADPIYDLDDTVQRSDLTLDFSAGEAAAIGVIFPSVHLTGLNANKRAFLNLKSPSFIHLSTHMTTPNDAVVPTDEMALVYGDLLFRKGPQESARDRGIALSGMASRQMKDAFVDDEFGSGVLSGEEFRTFNLTDTVFITFAGCDSAVVDVDSASGLAGFIHDALQGGVRFAIGSVWPLSDEFSALFFTRFYQELSEGASSGAAFQKALAKTRSSASSTFQWGSLDFYGDPFVNLSLN